MARVYELLLIVVLIALSVKLVVGLSNGKEGKKK